MRVANNRWRYTLVIVVLVAVALLVSRLALAQQPPPDDFALQVTPSPIVETLTPGESKTIELKVRNDGSKTEELKAQLRTFQISDETGRVEMGNDEPAEVKGWVRFENPTFTIRPGEWYTQRIKVDVPADAGFSYSFAAVITKKDPPPPVPGQRQIVGSVADFVLLSVDRPGATRKFEIVKLSSAKRVYEYLPATLEFTLKNTGNTIIQPYGNIFIQRSSNSNEPISTLPLNASQAYLLPGSSRQLQAQWQDGFPVYKTVKGADNAEATQQLSWEWSKVDRIRVGKYVARMVAIYNDGQRDIPVSAEISFWVIPWKILLGLLVVVLIIGFGLFGFIRQMFGGKRGRRKGRKERLRGSGSPHA